MNRLLAATLFVLANLFTPDLVFAGTDTPIGKELCTVVLWFTGNTGKGLATIAIVIVGIWKLLGKISGPQAIIVAVGIAILFGAAGIVDAMNAGAGSGCATT